MMRALQIGIAAISLVALIVLIALTMTSSLPLAVKIIALIACGFAGAVVIELARVR